MESAPARIRLIQSLLATLAVAVLAFQLLDVFTGVPQAPLLVASRIVFLAAYLPACWALPRIAQRFVAPVIYGVTAATSIGLGLMCAGTGGVSSPSATFLWTTPLIMGLLFLDRPRVPIVSGLFTVGAAAWVLRYSGVGAEVAAYWIGVVLVCSALAAVATTMYSRIQAADLARLQRAEARTAQILEALPMGIVVRSRERQDVLYRNAAAGAFRRAAATTDALEDIADSYRLVVRGTESPYPSDKLPIAQALQGKTTTVLDVERLEPDGSRIPLEIHGVPIHAADGSVDMGVTVFWDVSEQERMKAQLAQSERLSTIGTLAAGVVHEINNPLCFVACNLQFALEELRRPGPFDRSEVAKVLAESIEGTTRITAIIRDLKMFSRQEDGPGEPVEAVEPHKALRSALTMVGAEIRRRARLSQDLGPVPMVLGSEQRLCQVFVNLLVNAAQAIPEGAPAEHEIRVATQLAPSGEVVITVRDSGCGIPQHLVPRIFDPFFTTKPAGVGTGLGLSVVHGILERIGGRIEVDTKVGVGTTFRLLLRPAIARAA